MWVYQFKLGAHKRACQLSSSSQYIPKKQCKRAVATRSLQCVFASVLVLFNVQVHKTYVETRRSRPLWIKSRDLRIMCWYSLIKGKVERAVLIILITVLCLLRNWCFEYKGDLPAFLCGLSPTKLCSTYSATLSGKVKTEWFNLLEAKLHSNSWRYIRKAKREPNG